MIFTWTEGSTYECVGGPLDGDTIEIAPRYSPQAGNPSYFDPVLTATQSARCAGGRYRIYATRDTSADPVDAQGHITATCVARWEPA